MAYAGSKKWRHANMTPERQMWQEVVLQAFMDIGGRNLSTSPGSEEMDRRNAMNWPGSRDFHMVCTWAGIDPDFLFDAYRSGRLDPLDLVDKRTRRRAGE
jgi:hypothetical protein